LLSLGGAAALSAGVLVGVGLREAVADPEIRRVEFALPGWPADQRSLSIALLADIHLGNRAMDVRRLESIVDQVNGARPDLVLIAGDFLVGHDPEGAAERAAALQEPLSRLRAPMGVIAVLGNHDHWTAPESVTGALARAGVILLTNRAVRRGPLAIIGVDDVFSRHDDLGSALASWKGVGGIPVVLTHSPDLVHRLRADMPLVLAGHTHCGQVVVPWLGPLASRSPRQNWRPLYDTRYRCGIIRDGRRTIVVTAGLGSGTMPIRLGAPPDWWLIRVGAPGASTE
jgi:predicted MPP superfamily phosphohydrolase